MNEQKNDIELKKNAKLAAIYREYLSPSKYLVAFKMLKSLEGFEEVKHHDKSHALCQLLTQTRYFGRARIFDGTNMGCAQGSEILGFKDVPPDVWKRYKGWLMATEEAAANAETTLPKLKFGEYVAAFVSPLERCPVVPDTVVLFGNSAQVGTIMSAYQYNKGKILTMRMTGVSTCGEALVAPMLTGEPKVVIPDQGFRVASLPSDIDLIFSFPGTMLEDITQGLEYHYHSGGTRYPVAWTNIQAERHMVTNLQVQEKRVLK